MKKKIFKKYILIKIYSRNILLLIILFTSLFLNSCSGNSKDNNTNKWRQGTEGIVFNFNKDNPSNEVISSQNLNVVLEYSNKGSYDVNDLRFYLYGYDPNILFGSNVQASNQIAVEGKSLYVPQGSQTNFISWQTQINSPINAESFKQELTITACYSYKTIASPELCIEPKTYTTTSQKCKFTVEDLGSSQGAPIVITSINPITTDDKIYLEIYFSNKGKGNPFSGSLNSCYNSIDIKDIDTINSISIRTSGTTFTCKPKTKIRLTNGNGFVICEAPLRTTSYYITPIDIILDYNYRESISKTITIINLK